MSLRFFLIAGEASGDRLGAALMRGLKDLHGDDIRFDGVGGPLMQDQGLQSLFPMQDISIIGLAAILADLPRLLRRVRDTAQNVVDLAPDALITIDAQEFSARVAGRVKQAAPHIPTIHYVAPTVWAWRPKRAQKMAGLYDHVMALFPFEPPYMQAAGISCDFVGHPVVAAPPVTDADKAALRTTLGIGGDDPVILALPGSRQSEVERLAPIFGQTLHHIDRTQNPPHIILPAAPGMAELVAGQIQTWPGPVHVLNPADLPPDQGQHRKRVAFAMADVALAASGTVSLELAAANTPMVIAYKTNWLSQILIKSLLQIDTVTLVNLITDTRVVPEFLGANCRADQIAPTLLALLTDPAAQDGQRAAMRATMAQLGQGGDAPGLRAAQSVTRFIKGKA